MGQDVTLSLISHTNVGKTTLARTLLRRDVGEVMDQAHVTEEAEAFTLIEAGGTVPAGAVANALPQAFSVLFYTFSSTPVVLDTVLPGGADYELIRADGANPAGDD